MLKPRNEIESYYRRRNDQFIPILKLWGKIHSELMNGNQFVAARYNHSKRDAIERWISSASGTIRTLKWTLGDATYATAMSITHPEEIASLRLTNDWGVDGDKRVAPLGDIPIDMESEMHPSHQLRPEQWVNFLYHHVVAVHREIYHIHKFHPGKWHPMFMQRITNTLLWLDGSIRALEWSLQKCNDDHAFYAFDGDVLEQLTKALEGSIQFDQNLLTRYDIAKDDHDPDKDFGSGG